MTVGIALLDRIVSDSRLTLGESDLCTVDKVFKLPEGGLMMTAGDGYYTRLFEQSMLIGEEPDLEEPDEEDRFEGIVVRPALGLIYYDDSFAPFNIKEPFCCIGSGWMVAKSWMLATSDPVQAIRRVIEVDHNCGFPIKVTYLDGTVETIDR